MQNGDKHKSVKSKKKNVLKRRKTLKKSDLKVGYSEGAEENKGGSFGDS